MNGKRQRDRINLKEELNNEQKHYSYINPYSKYIAVFLIGLFIPYMYIYILPL